MCVNSFLFILSIVNSIYIYFRGLIGDNVSRNECTEKDAHLLRKCAVFSTLFLNNSSKLGRRIKPNDRVLAFC